MISPFTITFLPIYEVLARLEATESSDDSRPRCCREQRRQHRAGFRSPAWVRANLGWLSKAEEMAWLGFGFLWLSCDLRWWSVIGMFGDLINYEIAGGSSRDKELIWGGEIEWRSYWRGCVWFLWFCTTVKEGSGLVVLGCGDRNWVSKSIGWWKTGSYDLLVKWQIELKIYVM